MNEKCLKIFMFHDFSHTQNQKFHFCPEICRKYRFYKKCSFDKDRQTDRHSKIAPENQISVHICNSILIFI